MKKAISTLFAVAMAKKKGKKNIATIQVNQLALIGDYIFDDYVFQVEQQCEQHAEWNCLLVEPMENWEVSNVISIQVPVRAEMEDYGKIGREFIDFFVTQEYVAKVFWPGVGIPTAGKHYDSDAEKPAIMEKVKLIQHQKKKEEEIASLQKSEL